MKLSIFSLFALLALAIALLADGAEGRRKLNRSMRRVKEDNDCCGKRQFCCGSSCLKKSLQPLVKCAGPPTCCGPPPPPFKDCCPANTFCCGRTCAADSDKPRIICPAFSDCSKSDPCAEKPKVVGNCRAAIPRWSFVEKTGKCEQFSYGGCGGTKNNFTSEKECKKTCNVVDEPPVLEDCCPKGSFCCGTGCLPDGAQTFAPCGPNKCTCKPVDPEPCICTKEYAPLCNPKTMVTYGNKCEAVTCGGENIDDLVEGECVEVEEKDDCCPKDQFCCGQGKQGCLPLSQQPFTLCATNSNCCAIEDPGCFCPAVFMPVCSKSTGTTYGNSCEAGCAKDDEGPFVDGACEKTEDPTVLPYVKA